MSCLGTSTHLSSQAIQRSTRRFNTLKVPRKIQAALPYAAKSKVPTAQRNATYLQKRAVVMEPEEKRAVALLQQIQALRKDKIHKRDEKKKEQREVYKKKVAKLDESKGEKRKEERREQLKTASIKQKRAAESEGGRGGKKRRRE